MKRIAASVGLVALSASALHAVDGGGLSSLQSTKPWSVGASLRGFYDDNINTSHSDRVDSFGFAASPFINVGWAGEQTSVNAGYTFSAKWYDERPDGNSTDWDLTHTFDIALQHAFSPRYQVAVQDSFVIGQEPDVLRAGDTYATFQRIPGDNIRNYGSIVFNAEITPLLGLEVGYANAYYNYADDNPEVEDVTGQVIRASNSGLLDRLEHAAHIDSRWHIQPQTVGIIGYMFGMNDYTADEAIQGVVSPPGAPGSPVLMSDERNSRSHYFYGGVEHSFRPDLSGSLKAGAQHIDFYNDPSDYSSWSPYVVASLRYFYSAESTASLGFTYSRSASDVIGDSVGDFVYDTDTATAYASVTQRLLPRFFVTLVGTYQHSMFNGGGSTYDDQADDFFLLGVDFGYKFNPYLSAHVGYNYDQLCSDIPGRGYDRNRVYVGLTAVY